MAAVLPAEAQAHLQEAEQLLKGGDREGACKRYDLAADLARKSGPPGSEGMILVGKGYALLTSAAQTEQLTGKCDMEAFAEAARSLSLARETASEAQAAFLDNLLRSAEEGRDRGALQDHVGKMEHVLAAAGLEKIPREESRLHGGVLGDGGVLHDGWVREVGQDCGEKQQSQHAEVVKGLGLSEADQALVELVARDGVGNWEKKAAELDEKLLCGEEGKVGPRKHADPRPRSAAQLEEVWDRIAPQVKERLALNPEMPCGHTCGTCPTKDSCHLHDDLEDLA